MLKTLLRFVELHGISGSGKTRWAEQQVRSYPHVARINRDDLRRMLRNDAYQPRDEDLVRTCEAACAVAAVKSGYNVIIDDTNLSGDTLWQKLAEGLGIKHTNRWFKVDVGEAILRDISRTDKLPVGPKVIRIQASRLPKGR